MHYVKMHAFWRGRGRWWGGHRAVRVLDMHCERRGSFSSAQQFCGLVRWKTCRNCAGRDEMRRGVVRRARVGVRARARARVVGACARGWAPHLPPGSEGRERGSDEGCRRRGRRGLGRVGWGGVGFGGARAARPDAPLARGAPTFLWVRGRGGPVRGVEAAGAGAGAAAAAAGAAGGRRAPGGVSRSRRRASLRVRCAMIAAAQPSQAAAGGGAERREGVRRASARRPRQCLRAAARGAAAEAAKDATWRHGSSVGGVGTTGGTIHHAPCALVRDVDFSSPSEVWRVAATHARTFKPERAFPTDQLAVWERYHELYGSTRSPAGTYLT